MKITKILKENLWDKLVKAYPELEEETSVEDDVVEELVETAATVTEEVITEEKTPWDKLVDTYPELAESAVEESFDEEGNREHCDKCGTTLNDGGTCPECDDGEEDYAESIDPDVDSFEYDDEYDFDNEDDIVTQDRIHAALYGGDREYCDQCGSKLVRDEWGGTCPHCNETEIEMSRQDSLYDDDIEDFSEDTTDADSMTETFDDSEFDISPDLTAIGKAIDRGLNKMGIQADVKLTNDAYTIVRCYDDCDNLSEIVDDIIAEYDAEIDPEATKEMGGGVGFKFFAKARARKFVEAKKFGGKSTNLGTMTREEALKCAQEMMEKIKGTDQECAGLLYGLIDKETGEEFFTPECVTHAEAEKLAKALDSVYILWNKSAKSPELD